MDCGGIKKPQNDPFQEVLMTTPSSPCASMLAPRSSAGGQSPNGVLVGVSVGGFRALLPGLRYTGTLRTEGTLDEIKALRRFVNLR